jgi:hypothetical protein
MKRLFLLILLVMMVAFFVRLRRAEVRRPEAVTPSVETRRSFERARHELRQAVAQSRRDAHRAAAAARNEAREALDEAREALQDARQEVKVSLREAAQEIREAVDGIPVPIIPGTCVVEAVAQPPVVHDLPPSPLAEAPPQPPMPPTAPGFPGLNQPQQPPVGPAPPGQNAYVRTDVQKTSLVPGLISITEDRAKEEARKHVESVVTEWLEAVGVPRTWTPPAGLIDDMILDTHVNTVVKDDDPLYTGNETLYEAKLKVDVSPERRATFVRAYQHQLVHKRMVLLGAGLAFVLSCLAAIYGYIRTDEATKGYYTNRLRLLAAAGVGAASVAILRMVA